MNYNTTHQADGIVYFNVNLQKGLDYYDSEAIPARFNQQLTAPIVSNTKDYNMAITRFSVSSSSIPVFICPVRTGQSNLNLTPYVITMTNGNGGAYLANIAVDFIPQYNATHPQPPLERQDFSTGYYNVYTIQWLVTLVNNTMKLCVDMLIAQGAPISASYPYIVYNSVTNLFELVALGSQYDQHNAYPVRIYFNKFLNPLFGLQVQSVTPNQFPGGQGVAYLLAFGNVSQGGTIIDSTMVKMIGDHRSIDLFSPLAKIIITSTSLPTRGEYIQPAATYGSNVNPANFGQTVAQNVITDFEPDFFTSVLDNRNFIQYNVTGVANYRLIQFNASGQSELRTFDIQVYWADKYGNVYPLMLEIGGGVSMKFAFVPKTYFQSD